MFLSIQQPTSGAPPVSSSFHVASWAVVTATLMGPILAVLVTRWVDRLREDHNRKQWIFRTLMATRDTNLPISMEHVQALQMIEVEFRKTKKKEKAVVDAWKLYQQHLNTAYPPGDPNNCWGRIVRIRRPTIEEAHSLPYFTSNSKLSEWLLNSGAYMHWMLAMPVWYLPLSWMRVEYSNTYTPFGR